MTLKPGQANGKRSLNLTRFRFLFALHGPRYLFVFFSAACFALHGPRYLLGAFWVLLGAFWVLLGCFLVLLSTLGALLGCSWALLGRSFGILGRSWGALGTTSKKHTKKDPENDRFGPPKRSQNRLQNHQKSLPKIVQKNLPKTSDFGLNL